MYELGLWLRVVFGRAAWVFAGLTLVQGHWQYLGDSPHRLRTGLLVG